MERLTEFAISGRGVLYRHWEADSNVHPKRISPKSYYAGERVGWINGLGVGFGFGVLFLSFVFGFCL